MINENVNVNFLGVCPITNATDKNMHTLRSLTLDNKSLKCRHIIIFCGVHSFSLRIC